MDFANLPRLRIGRAALSSLLLFAFTPTQAAHAADHPAWRSLDGLADPLAYVMTPPYRITDPLYAYDTASPNRHQWALGAVNLPAVLAWTRGRVLIGAADGGVKGAFDGDGRILAEHAPHPDLEPNLRRHLSYDLMRSTDTACDTLWPLGLYSDGSAPPDYYVMHGTHVAGIMAAAGNNGIGVSGACPGCSFALMAASPASGCMNRALPLAVRNGFSVVNFSWGFPAAPNDSGDAILAPAAIEAAADYDVFLVAATGNFLRGSIDYPARHPKVTAVAAAAMDEHDPARRARLWDERNGLNHVGVVQPPAARCDLAATPPRNMQCGSNSGPGTDLVAPGAQILSTVTRGYTLGTPGNPSSTTPCGSETDPSGQGLYGVCTGTSMSAPLVAGIAGLVRSVNPLLSWEETRQVLTATARNDAAAFIDHLPQTMGAGLPDAEAAVRTALGRARRSTVFNRLTPLFSLLACRPACAGLAQPLGADAWLFTTSPQLAAVAQNGEMNFAEAEASSAPPGVRRHIRYAASREAAPGIGAKIDRAQYRLRHPALNPAVPPGADPDTVSPQQAGASAYLFTTPRDPVSGAETDPATGHSYLVPLLRLSARCDQLRKGVYAVEENGVPGSRAFFESRGTRTQNCATAPDQAGYYFDAVEGYLWRAWLPGAAQPLPQPPGTRKLLRYYNAAKASWALLLDNETNLPAFAGYAPADESLYGRNLLGYVYPNTDADADGLIDGFELVLGTDPLRTDSDCDGRDDGVEFPLARLAASDPLDGSCLPPLHGPRSRLPFHPELIQPRLR